MNEAEQVAVTILGAAVLAVVCTWIVSYRMDKREEEWDVDEHAEPFQEKKDEW